MFPQPGPAGRAEEQQMGERRVFKTLFGKLHKRALLIKKQTPALKKINRRTQGDVNKPTPRADEPLPAQLSLPFPARNGHRPQPRPSGHKAKPPAARGSHRKRRRDLPLPPHPLPPAAGSLPRFLGSPCRNWGHSDAPSPCGEAAGAVAHRGLPVWLRHGHHGSTGVGLRHRGTPQAPLLGGLPLEGV